MDGNELRIMVGEEIRRQRESQGLSLHVFADMAGTSYTHIWKVENGKVNVGLDLLGRISNALGIPLRDLFVPHTTWDVEVTRHDLRDQSHDQAGNNHTT